MSWPCAAVPLTEQKVYSVYIEDYLLMCQSAPEVKTLECGWGGSNAPHMVATSSPTRPRWQRSVLGINDCANPVCSMITIARNYT